MPLLSYTPSDFPFQPFTVIRSADINQCYNDIKTLLNTTGLDDTNIQTAGVSITKLKVGTGTVGQFISNNGSTIIWSSNPLLSQFNVIIGSAAQVTAGTATNSTFASYTQVAGDRVLVLPGYATNEAWTITQPIYVQGLGHSSIIQGAITLSSGSTYAKINGIQTQSSLTINSGVSGCFCTDIWFTGTNTFVDNNTSPSNFLIAMQG